MAMTAYERSRFRERGKTYLIGVAIGCMLAAVMFMSRWMMVKQQEARRAASGSPPGAVQPGSTAR
jgi:hypothetical protein